MSSGMWAEKYRPQSLDEMVNQTEIVSRLKRFVEDRNLPHLLFVGPAGVGKTTSILALARDLPGLQYGSFIMELKATSAASRHPREGEIAPTPTSSTSERI